MNKALQTLTLVVENEEKMLMLGKALAKVCEPGAIFFLEGDLGVGKTTLVRGILRGFGHRGAVKSPTYTLVEQYDLSGQNIYHFDLYRLASPEELEYMGGRDYFQADTVSFIEWPMNAEGFLPQSDITVSISYQGFDQRNMKITAETETGQKMLTALKAFRGL